MFNRKYKERIERLERDLEEFKRRMSDKDETIIYMNNVNDKIMETNKTLADELEKVKKEKSVLKRKNTILTKELSNNE